MCLEGLLPANFFVTPLVDIFFPTKKERLRVKLAHSSKAIPAAVSITYCFLALPPR